MSTTTTTKQKSPEGRTKSGMKATDPKRKTRGWTAAHPRLHPKRVPVTIVEDFSGGEKDTYVKVRFPDGLVKSVHWHHVHPALTPKGDAAAATPKGDD
jgi:hypothetical protein